MTFNIYFRPDAESDIEEASRWYEQQRVGLGADFLDEVLRYCELISTNPNIYPEIYKSFRRAIINRFPFGIFYKVEEQSIIIIAVMHGSRHPKKWQKRMGQR